MQQGMVYVFTGDGKGKTSAAVGVGARAALSGMKVAMVAWYKEARWPISELMLPDKLPTFQIYLAGRGFYKLPTDHATPTEHKEAAEAAMAKARELMGTVDVLILDEANNAVGDGLLNPTDLIDLISKRGKTHVILTGRGAHADLIAIADLVTDMQKVKHPFDVGKKAVKGLDY